MSLTDATGATAASSVDARGLAATTAVTELPPSVTAPGPPGNLEGLPAGKAPAGVSARVISRAGGSAVPGGFAQFFVIVLSNGTEATTAGRPVSLTFEIPTGLSFAGITDANNLKGLLAAPSPRAAPKGAWMCRPAVRRTVTCDYGTRGARGAFVAVPLPPESTIASIVRLFVSRTFDAAPSGSLITLRSTLSAPGNTASGDRSTSASTDVLPGLSKPALLPDTETLPAAVHAGELVTDKLQFVNVGSGAALSAAGRPAISLTNVLPPTLVNGWRAAGAGWTCSGSQNASPSCSFGHRLAAGAITPTLVPATAGHSLRRGGDTLVSARSMVSA